MTKVTVKNIHGGLNEREYICSPEFAAKVASALNTKPVSGAILSGPAGTGKSYLPQVLSDVLERDLFFYQCSAGTREDDLLMKLLPSEDTVSGIKIEPGKIYEATIASNERKVILVLDEWDKTRPTADGFFLDYLQYGRLSIPGKTVMANLDNMTIFLTTNNEREFQEPLLRRFPKIDVDPLEPTLVKEALVNTHSNSPHIHSAVEIYVKTVISGMPKPATIQELRQFLDASRFLGKGADWDSLVYQFITKTPENHSILAKISEKMDGPNDVNDALKDIRRTISKIDPSNFGTYMPDKNGTKIKNAGPQMPRGKVLSYDKQTSNAECDIDLDEHYGVIESNDACYTFACKTSKDAPDNFLLPGNFAVGREIIVAKEAIPLVDIEDFNSNLKSSKIFDGIRGEIVFTDKYCTVKDLETFYWWPQARLYKYSKTEVVGRVRYFHHEDKNPPVPFNIDFIWTQDQGLEIIVPFRVLKKFVDACVQRRRYYKIRAIHTDSRDTTMPPAYVSRCQASSYLASDYNRRSNTGRYGLPVLTMKALMDEDVIGMNNHAFGNMVSGSWVNDRPPFYRDLYKLGGVNCNINPHHTKLYNDSFEVEIAQAEVEEARHPYCINYRIYSKPPYELIQMLSAVAPSHCVPIFKTVKAKTNSIVKELKSKGWFFSNKIGTKKYKSKIMYRVMVLENVAIFYFLIAGDIEKTNSNTNKIHYVPYEKYTRRFNAALKTIGGLADKFQDG